MNVTAVPDGSWRNWYFIVTRGIQVHYNHVETVLHFVLILITYVNLTVNVEPVKIITVGRTNYV